MADAELPVEPADPACPRCGKPRTRVEFPYVKLGTVALVCWGCSETWVRSRTVGTDEPPGRGPWGEVWLPRF